MDEWSRRIGNMRQWGRRYRKWQVDKYSFFRANRKYIARKWGRRWLRHIRYKKGQLTGRNRAGQIWALQNLNIPRDLIEEIVNLV